MKTLDVTIVNSDFIDGSYADCNDCPLARAVRRALNLDSSDQVGVDCDRVRVFNYADGKETYYKNGVFNGRTYKAVALILADNPTYKHKLTLEIINY